MRRRLLFSLSIIFPIFAGACSSQLETGYQPKPLDMPISQREALYADPYGPNALQAQQEQGGGGAGGGAGFHRPGTP